MRRRLKIPRWSVISGKLEPILSEFFITARVYVCVFHVASRSAVFHPEISIFPPACDKFVRDLKTYGVCELFRAAVSPNLSSVRQESVVIRAFLARICPSRNTSIMETATNLIEISFIRRGFGNRQRVKVYSSLEKKKEFLSIVRFHTFLQIFLKRLSSVPLDFSNFSQIYSSVSN